MPSMTVRTPFVWSDDCTRHEPKGEVWVGVTIEGTEIAERAHVIRATLEAAGATLVPTVAHDDTELLAVHDPQLVAWLRDGYDEWVAAGFLEVPGQDRIVPYVFPTQAMLGGMPLRLPTGVHGRAGRFAYDTMTLVGPGTWEAARGAVDAALTAVDAVTTGDHAGRLRALPPARSPRHPRRLRRLVLPEQRGRRCQQPPRPRSRARRHRRHRRAPRQRHAVDLLRARRRLLRIAARRPCGRLVPALRRTCDEKGTGPGAGATQNRPLAEGLGDEPVAGGAAGPGRRRQGLRAHRPGRLLRRRCGSRRPREPAAGHRRRLSQSRRGTRELGLPTVAVQEGGYHLRPLATSSRRH